MAAPRIALIHAMQLAIEPVGDAFRQLWGQARVTHLLEDSLLASDRGIKLQIRIRAIPAANAALQQGRGAEHDRLIAAAAAEIGKCDALVLGQFSMARAATGIPVAPGRKVLTSPQSAVNRLKQIFDAR